MSPERLVDPWPIRIDADSAVGGRDGHAFAAAVDVATKKATWPKRHDVPPVVTDPKRSRRLASEVGRKSVDRLNAVM
jgi:hypothetical protein